MNPQPEKQRLKIGSLDGVLAVVPHLLGFHPSSSLVVLGIAGPRGQVQLAFRYDLPDPPDSSLSGEIAAHASAVLGRQHLTAAIVIGYGPGSLVKPVADMLGEVERNVLGRFENRQSQPPAAWKPSRRVEAVCPVGNECRQFRDEQRLAIGGGFGRADSHSSSLRPRLLAVASQPEGFFRVRIADPGRIFPSNRKTRNTRLCQS